MKEMKCNISMSDSKFTGGVSHPSECPTKKEKTILLVDDEPLVLHRISRILQEAQFIVYTCEQWARLPGFIRRVNPDLILLDYNMPSLKGDSICSILKKDAGKSDLKIVIFSAEDEILLKTVSMKCGADGYIKKNISSEELICRISDFLTSKQPNTAPKAMPTGRSYLTRALIVDDSPIPRKMWRHMISEKYSCDTCEAKNGYEAIQQLYENPNVDLILLDINMPDMNGLQFLDAIRKIGHLSKIPVIIVSTEDEEEKVLAGLKLGARGYIIKPFTPNALCAVIDSIVKKESTSH